MAQHDYVIDNSTGANVRADINSALQAIVTNNSGSSAPSATFPFMLFADSSAGTMKIRNAADNAFIELFQLDGTFTLEDGSASTPALAFRDDLNTGIFSSAADTFNVATGGVERMELGTTTIFNEDGADVDFRIEGDTEANLFYVDAGNNRIGIGTASPQAELVIRGSTPQVVLEPTSDSQNCRFQFATTDGTIQSSMMGGGSDGAAIKFLQGFNERLRIDSSGRLLIGHSSHLSVAGVEAHLQVLGTGSDDSSIMLSRTSNDIHPAFLCFVKSRATIIGDVNSVASGDSLGKILFFGADGTDDDTVGAEIGVFVDGTPGANDMPSRIVFKTTADGANSPSTPAAMTVNSSQNVGVGTESPAKKLHVFESGVATIRLETGDSRGQAFDFLSTNGASSNTGTLSIRNEAGQSFIDFSHNGGSPKTTILNTGSQQFLFDSDGLKFGSDTAAANALDDYEEGDYVPNFTVQSGSVTIDSNNKTLIYTKIGRKVTIIGQLKIASVSNPSGIFRATLPFTRGNNTEQSERTVGNIVVTNAAVNNANEFTTHPDGGVDSNLEICSISGTTIVRNGGQNMQADTFIAVNYTYFTAS